MLDQQAARTDLVGVMDLTELRAMAPLVVPGGSTPPSLAPADVMRAQRLRYWVIVQIAALRLISRPLFPQPSCRNVTSLIR